MTNPPENTSTPRRWRPVAVAAAIALTGAALSQPAAMAFPLKDSIGIAQGVSITPAPGWTLGNRGGDWVALNNADTSAQMRVTVKPAGGTDPVAVLQADINQYTNGASAILGNVRNLTGPDAHPVQGNNFQQQASIDYTADVVTPQGTIPVIGTFTELLNTSNGRSAFVDFRQDGNATTRADNEGGMMVTSML
ncbi:hypothetical protein MRAB57_5179 [Mycobacterium rhizamassiliense]|uniref:Uncharacterized protein n=2 Tax=Mycobacterium rhizamassiliense TaxID=1841860 RepID=A0A2U3P0R3_9MYCO|nr:hypothetical protein MRAB57_5179 [Mycobacterium rhizamassiliense]